MIQRHLMAAAAFITACLGCASSDSTAIQLGSGGAPAAPDPVALAFPDAATLHRNGVATTCALNEGVCHRSKSYPELGASIDMRGLIAAPCQVGAADLARVPDECEVPGDRLVLGGVDHEIMLVKVPDLEPSPPKYLQLKLDKKPATLDLANARIRRFEGEHEVFSKPIDGAWISAIDPVAYPEWIAITLDGVKDASLPSFLDPRSFRGDRVRMGDPNQNGIAHASKKPWAEIVPSDPSRSFLYKRLVTDAFGAQMPLIERTWSAAATRAVWCWIRSLPATATKDSVRLDDAIDYASCPIDPDAPDPNAVGGFETVRAIFGSRCATSGCHTAEAHAASLDMTPDAGLRKRLVDVPSTQEKGALLVAEGAPTASYLVCKVDPACTTIAAGSAHMPLSGEPLSSSEIQAITAWISSGAPTM
jgi:hypothetical protein